MFYLVPFFCDKKISQMRKNRYFIFLMRPKFGSKNCKMFIYSRFRASVIDLYHTDVFFFAKARPDFGTKGNMKQPVL